MLNQIPASEANNSGVFLRNYLDYIEELPDDIVRILSVVRELDVKTSNIVNETEELSEKILTTTGEAKSKHYSRLQQILIKLQDLNDEKIRYNQALSELIETKFRAVERDFQTNILSKQERPQSPVSSASSTAKNASIVQQVLSNLPLIKNSSTSGSNMSSSTNNSLSESLNITVNNGTEKAVKRSRRTRTDTILDVIEQPEPPVKVEPTPTKATSSTNSTPAVAVKKSSSTASNASNKKKKKKTTAKQANNSQTSQVVEQQVATLQDEAIDPDEETYCLCGMLWTEIDF
ncbi:hypothetical protein ACKWTF_004692 [Chironomus riparius]